MAVIEAPPSIKDQVAQFQALRKTLGLAIKEDYRTYSFDDAQKTLEAFMVKKPKAEDEAKVRTMLQILVQNVAGMEPTEAQKQEMAQAEALQGTINSFQALRLGLGLAEKSGYTAVDVAETKTKLAEAKKSPTVYDDMLARIKIKVPAATKEDVSETVKVADAIFENMTKIIAANQPPSPAEIRQTLAMQDAMILRAGLGYKADEKIDVAATLKKLADERAAISSSIKGDRRAALFAEKLQANLTAAGVEGVPVARISEAVARAEASLTAVAQLQQPAPTPSAQLTPGQKLEAMVGVSAIRHALGLKGFDAANPYTAQEGAKTVAAYDAKLKELGGDPAKMQAFLLEAMKTSTNAKVKALDTADEVKTIMAGLKANVGILNAVQMASAQPAPSAPAAAGAGQQAAPVPTVDKSADIRKVEETLKKLGIDVGQVDGVADDKFHEATTSLKNLIASVSGAKVDPGKCTPEDCDKLLKGIQDFLGSQSFKELQALRKGEVPASLGLDMVDTGLLKGALSVKNEAERLEFVLKRKADDPKTDPALREGIKKIPPHILKNMPAVLDVLEKEGEALAKSLKVVYTPAPAPAGAAPAPDVPPPATGAAPPPAPVPTPPPAPQTAEELKTKTNDSVLFVEGALLKYAAPMLGQFMGIAGKLGLGQSVLPTLTAEDVQDKNPDGTLKFGENSKKMVATLLMGLKEMAGIDPPDGSYSEEIGATLLNKILTDEKMKMVRDKMGIPQMTAEMAEVVLAADDPTKPTPKDANAPTADEKKALAEYERIMKLREKTKDLQKLFESLNHLHAQNMLLKDQEAQSVNKINMMMDAASSMLDKWAPGIKRMLQSFFTQNQFGQMIAGALGMFGIDVNRLWGDKSSTPEQVMERSKPLVEKGFNYEVGMAREELKKAGNANPTFAELMGKTEQIITDHMENGGTGFAFNQSMKLIFGDENKDTMKNAVRLALAAAKAVPEQTPEAAAKAFSAKLVELGTQHMKNTKQDPALMAARLEELEKNAQGTHRDLTATPQGVSFANQYAQAGAPPQSGAAPPPAPGAQGGADTRTAPVAPGSVQVGPLPKPTDGKTIDINGLRYELSVSRDTKQYEQDPLRFSNGRVGVLQEVLAQYATELKLGAYASGLTGKSKDRLTPNTALAMEELLIRAQISKGDVKDAKDLSHKYDDKSQAAVVDYMRSSGVREADIKRFTEALDSMQADMKSYKSTKGVTGDLTTSVWDQSFLTNQIKVAISPVPTPAPSQAVVAPPPAPPPPPAPAPVVADPYKGIAVDPKDAAIFEMYKNLNAGKSDPNCLPLYFAVAPNGDILKPEDYKALRDKGTDLKDYRIFAGIVDQASKKFEVLEVAARQPDGTMKNGKLPPAFDENGGITVSGKLIDNYAWSVEGKIYGRGGIMPNNDVIPKVIEAIQCDLDTRFGIPPIVTRTATPVQRDFKTAAPPPPPAPVETPPPADPHAHRSRRAHGADHRHQTQRIREYNERAGCCEIDLPQRRQGSPGPFPLIGIVARQASIAAQLAACPDFSYSSLIGNRKERPGVRVVVTPPHEQIRQNGRDCGCEESGGRHPPAARYNEYGQRINRGVDAQFPPAGG